MAQAQLSVSRIICDFVVLTVIAIPLLIFHKWVEPYKRGFYCDDETLYYPYRPSTVSREMLIIIGILIPTFLILLTEAFRTLAWEQNHACETYRCRKYNVHRLVVRLYVFIGYFFVGVCFNQLMVDIAKYTIGRLRPHFMEVCKPSNGYLNCKDDHRYIIDFECTGTDKYLVHESRLSFYSGHAAFSFYAAWYTSFYLQARLFRPLLSRLVLPVLQFSFFGGAAFVAYTRVSNYKHHWSDVLVGAIMGSIIGIINAIFVAEVFEKRELPQEYYSKKRVLGRVMHYRKSDECLCQSEENRNGVEGNEKPHSLSNVTAQRVVVHETRVPSVMRPTQIESHQYTSPYQAHYGR